MAAYIDLNPVRAGLVKEPKDYRFCGYAAALAGNALARQGLMSCKLGADWNACAAAYRMRLFVGGGSAHQSSKVLIDNEKIKEVIAQGGKLSLAEVLRPRVRHLSDGVALGSKDFVNEIFTLHREKFGPKRKDGARPIRALACIGLTALRDLRVRAFGSVRLEPPVEHGAELLIRGCATAPLTWGGVIAGPGLTHADFRSKLTGNPVNPISRRAPMQSLETLSGKLDTLTSLVKIQTEMLATINAQQVMNTARLETSLSVLREILAKQGVAKDKSMDACRAIFAKWLLMAKADNETNLKSPTSTSFPR